MATTTTDVSGFTPAQTAAFNAAAAQAPTGSVQTTGAQAPTGTTPAAAGASDFTTQLQNTLLKQSGIISSDSTQLEGKIQGAIDTVNKGNTASAAATTLNYDQQKANAQAAGQQQQTSFSEASRGYATNTAALKQLTDNTTKQVNDLEQRKQQLILQGDANAAQQVSTLQVQAIQFHQQAQQQVFSNLLGLGNLAQQNEQTKQQASQFQQTLGFQQQQGISTIALKYGLTVNPGDTLESITTRAMPYATKEEKAGLDMIQSQIRVNNANATKAIADANASGGTKSYDVDALATAVNNGGSAVLAGIKDPNIQAKVLNRAAEMQGASLVQQAFDAGDSKETAHDDIVKSTTLTPSAKAAALKALDTVYTASNSPAAASGGAPAYGSPFLNILNNLGAGLANVGEATGSFFTGIKPTYQPFSPLK